MAFNFIEIEKEKGRSIAVFFAAVVLFYFTGVWLACLCVFSAGASLASGRFVIFFPPAAMTHWILAMSFLIGSLHWLFSVHNLIERISAAAGARPIDREDRYHLYLSNIVGEISVAVGGRHIEPRVIPESGLNAFAIADFSGRAVIGVTEGVLCRLNRSQIEAVVAHEAAHIVSGDCLAATVTSSLAEIYEELFASATRDNISEGGQNFNPLAVIMFVVFGFVHGLGTVLRTFVSREREYRADALAVRLTRNPAALAEALYHLSSHWRGEGMRGDRLSSIFMVNPRFDPLDEAQGVIADLFSTHPPVRARIAVLADMAHMTDDELDRMIKEHRRVSPVLSRRVGHTESAAPLSLIAGSAPVAALAGHTARNACPRCASSLMQQDYEGVPVSVCARCGGVLVDQDRLTRILFRQDVEYSEGLLRVCARALERFKNCHVLPRIEPRNAWVITCPECGEKMRREFYAYSYAVEIDRCVRCKKVWFDKDELEILQYLFEHNKELFS
ncbi:MAG: zinc metalloprotease HtpX [Candidatus Omnitrophica bacterium]|nr:zinc metalloprotease HtpX [Candidatus Omnitrophota bacterium]MDD5774427.1 zinc metalloprotease HtpX [Candidatus Omnitrophota bacterium]